MVVDGSKNCYYTIPDYFDSTYYGANLLKYANRLIDSKKGIIFIRHGLVSGLLGDPSVLDFKILEEKAIECSSNKHDTYSSFYWNAER